MPNVTDKKKQRRTTLTLNDKLDIIKKMERGNLLMFLLVFDIYSLPNFRFRWLVSSRRMGV